MTQISRRPIKQELLDKTVDVFLYIFAKISSTATAKDFIDEFFTPTEKVMYSKRIAAFYLLLKNTPKHTIVNTLKLSSATVAKYAWYLDKSPTLKKILNTPLRRDQFKRLIDTILNEYILPEPGLYGTNWSAARQRIKEYQKRKETPL